MKKVNTVLGEVKSNDLGNTLMHEHIVFGFPGWNGDCTIGPFDEEKWAPIILEEIGRAKKQGVETIVDATPNECARNPQFLKKISELAEINLICSTGYYFEDFSSPAYWKNREYMGGDIVKEIYDMFITEISDGIAGTGIKPGVIKLATSPNHITDFEKKLFMAASLVQKETGIPIITHTSDGSMGIEQAELLLEYGANPNKVQIGHMCDCTDLDKHMKIMALGFYDAFDRLGHNGLSGTPDISILNDNILTLLKNGYENQITLGHDCVIIEAGRDVYRDEEHTKLFDMIHLDTAGLYVIPFLKENGITDNQIHKLTVDNPAKFFG